jgi:hypothetical protein
MSEEMEDGKFEPLELEPSASETDTEAASDSDNEGVSRLDEVRNELLAAIEELGLGSRDFEDAALPAAGCYLSIVPVDHDGHEGVVVGWLWRDSVVPGEAVRLAERESVDILNEALGPLLLALGFPIEPYAVDGRWIVTGSRKASSSAEIVGSPVAQMD